LLSWCVQKIGPGPGEVWGDRGTEACALGESTTQLITTLVTTTSAARQLTLGRSITGRVGVIPTRWPIVWGGHRRPNGGGANAHPYPDARAHVGSATINAAAINTSSANTASTDTAHGDSTGTDTARANSGCSIR